MRIVKKLALLLCLLFLFGCAPETEYLLSESVGDDGDGSPTRTTYEYDEAGRLRARSSEDDDFYGMGPLYERVEFEYDDCGELLRERIYDETGCISVREYVNSYDGSGRLTHSDSYTDGELFESRTNSYDEQGNLARTEFIHRSSYSTDTIVEIFDEAGNVLRNETTSELNGYAAQTVNETTSELNAYAAPTVTEYRYEAGKLAESRSDDGIRFVYTYGTDGRRERITRYIGDTVDTYREFTCDGNTETEIQYEADGTMIAKEIRTYDKAGNLIKEEYFDSSDRLWQTAIYSYIPK